MAFDLTPDASLDTEAFARSLGGLYRELRYKHLYDAIRNTATLDKLAASGWFPFAEVITAEFKEMLLHCESGFPMAAIEEKVLSAFNSTRLERMLARWMAKTHFATKQLLLREAVDAFLQRRPVAVIKILLTEIEGVLRDAHRLAHPNQQATLSDLLAFAADSGVRSAGTPGTLLFPTEFGRYLKTHTFAQFDAKAKTGTASSRHAVGHGAAAQDTYTMVRALQALLTLDQLAFFT